MRPTPEHNDESRWHLDKKVPLALIVTIIAQTIIAAWAASNIWTRVGELEHKVEIAAPQAERIIRLVWGFLCQGRHAIFCSPLSFHSFVRPAPRAFFRPDRIFPSPSRAAAVKDGASLAPPKACP
jgi:hypothetical protein